MPRAVAARAVPSKAVKGVVSRLRGPGNNAPDNTPALYGIGRYMIEQLEDRMMLTVITGSTPPAGTGLVASANVSNTFDFQDQFNNHVRVMVQGNIKVELVGSDVNGATNALTLNQVPGVLMSTDPITGRDHYNPNPRRLRRATRLAAGHGIEPQFQSPVSQFQSAWRDNQHQ